MNEKNKLTDAMNDIGDDLIRDAEDRVPVIMKKKVHWVRWIALAAAVLLIAVAVPVTFAVISGGSKSASERYDERVPATTAAPMEAEINSAEKAEKAAMEAPEGEASSGKSGYAIREDAAVAPADMPGEVDTGLVDDVPGDAPADEPADVVFPEAGQLTAGAWDDNAHFLKWKELFAKNEQNATSGKFATGELAAWNLVPTERVEVTVLAGETPVSDARVVFTAADGKTFTARTNRNGIAYVFGGATGSLAVTSMTSNEIVTATLTGEKEITVSFTGGVPETPETDNLIELMYVVDVTGSMGDEIRYIQSELGSVIEAVVAANPGARIRLALLFYRDAEDEDEFTLVDFKDVTDPADYASHLQVLKKQEAAGGGDYPEALDEALEQAVALRWTDGATKILFHVFDAPAHGEGRDRLYTAIQTAAELGVRVCPVIASGADLLTEYIARSEAIVTGGTFVFLTNDSGIGGDHLDPELPAVHEYLNALMIRLINGYHTGTFAEPVAWNAAK